MPICALLESLFFALGVAIFLVRQGPLLGRGIHGPRPVCMGETLEELSGPLVDEIFTRKRYGPMIGPYPEGQSTLISEPRFSTPCEMRFFPARERENGLFKDKPSTEAVFPFSRGKNPISQGLEHRGSPISVPFGPQGERAEINCLESREPPLTLRQEKQCMPRPFSL